MAELETSSHGSARPSQINAGPIENLDLSGVDPLRREEVRRRVSVVKAFLALPAPGDADRRRHAEALNLSSNQFMALVRAWREHQRASSVAGSGSTRGNPRSIGPRHLREDVRRVAEGAVAHLRPGATLSEATKAVANLCVEAGLAAPCKATVAKMLREKRRGQSLPEEKGVVVAGRCWLRLPVTIGAGIAMPQIAIAVRAEDGVVLAATMSEDPLRHIAVAAVAANMPGLTLVNIDSEMLAELPAVAGGIGCLSSPAIVRRHLARILGDGIEGVRLVYKAGAQARPERLLRARKDVPLSHCDAMAVIRTAIDSSNTTRGGPRAVWID